MRWEERLQLATTLQEIYDRNNITTLNQWSHHISSDELDDIFAEATMLFR